MLNWLPNIIFQTDAMADFDVCTFVSKIMFWCVPFKVIVTHAARTLVAASSAAASSALPHWITMSGKAIQKNSKTNQARTKSLKNKYQTNILIAISSKSSEGRNSLFFKQTGVIQTKILMLAPLCSKYFFWYFFCCDFDYICCVFLFPDTGVVFSL